MKLIKPSFEVWKQEPGLDGIYKQIEKAAKVCYKSEGNITGNSAKPFIDNVLLRRGHLSPLEHGTVYLRIPIYAATSYKIDEYKDNPYSKTQINLNGESCYYITTNMCVLVEHDWLDDLKYLCEPTEYHEKRITVKFILSRSTAQEYTRHRVFSFAMESQRYCNYSRDRFSKEVTFIIPCWIDILEGKYTNISRQSSKDGEYKQIMLHENNINAYPLTNTPEGRFLWNCFWSEHDYFDLLRQGWKPQQAREVLSNACKTELVMTGFADDWWGEYLVIDRATGLIDQRIHGKFYDDLNNIDGDKYRVVEKGFFPLRCSSGAHPSAQELAISLREEFIKRGYIEF